MIYVDQIDEAFVDEVEGQLPHTSGAWDMVDPREIIAAAINIAVLRGVVIESERVT